MYNKKRLFGMDPKLAALLEAKEIHDDKLEALNLEMFILPEPDMPDQFMSIKPWKGAIKAPSNPPKIVESEPEETYEIEFVHGYKSDVAIQNLYYNA